MAEPQTPVFPTLCLQSLFIFCRCWNSLNDIVFGWLSDHCCTRKTRRTDAIRFGGLVWAVAFVILWCPPRTGLPLNDETSFTAAWNVDEILAALHFVCALCLYDGGLTFVELNHSSLLAEITLSPSDRAECNMWSAICAGFGALTSWFAYLTWNPSDPTGFRVMTVAVAVLAWGVFEVSGRVNASFIMQVQAHPTCPRSASPSSEQRYEGIDTPSKSKQLQSVQLQQRRVTATRSPQASADDSLDSNDAAAAISIDSMCIENDSNMSPLRFFMQVCVSGFTCCAIAKTCSAWITLTEAHLVITKYFTI